MPLPRPRLALLPMNIFGRADEPTMFPARRIRGGQLSNLYTSEPTNVVEFDVCISVLVLSPKIVALIRVGHGPQASSHLDTTACACQCYLISPSILLKYYLIPEFILDDCCESI